MYQGSPEEHRHLVSAITRSAGRPPKALRDLDWRGFLRTYLANVDAKDLADRDPKEIAGAAMSHLAFAMRRRRTALVRVFNPTLREHGFVSPHTLIDVVNDDMPFLVDSINLALTERGLTLHFLAHPIFAASRDMTGTLRALHRRTEPSQAAKQRLESFQHLEVDRIVDPAALKSLAAQIERSMRDVRVACADWGPMKDAARSSVQDLTAMSARFDPTDLSETCALLEWMENRHFTFLGYREYRLRGRKGREVLEPIANSGLGILRPRHKQPENTNRTLPADIRRQSRSGSLCLVTKSNLLSTVHRPGYLDYVGIKKFDAKGALIGERRFLGLWTSAAFNSNPRDIPLLRQKVAQVAQHFSLAPDSHDGKALQHILETFPRDELFQASVAELNRIATGIFGLQDRPRVRVLLRRDPFRRFYSCLVFVPREKYNTQVRQRIERVIREAFSAVSMESQVQIAESNLARIHIVARTAPSDVVARIDPDTLERRVAAAVRSWLDAFRAALLQHFDEAYALQLFDKYAQAFPAAYTEDFQTEAAALDVSFLEAVEKQPARLHLDIYRPDPRRKEKLFLKIFRSQDAIPISDLLPMLENMGLKVIAERPYEIEFAGQKRAWIQDLELLMQAPPAIALEALDLEIKSAFTAVWNGRMDSDSLNQLTLSAGIPWRMVTVLRVYCRFLLQTGLPFSQGYIAQVLQNNASIVRLLAELFTARFDPQIVHALRQKTLARLGRDILAALEEVTRSDEDRILRALWNALSATVRTNAYQTDASGQLKEYLSFKLESQQLRELPLPKPLFEIFVFSPRMEGVHLRMGYVARGGIRWSDRREDFRTEVLGLMKAQQVKNTVIVPVGAKGGFVVRRMPVEREAQQAEVIACYQTLIRGMLDITDNIVADKITPPAMVIRHDRDDPYLVVAADKGTATFSDIANAISQEYGFWLGDAFASGGSAGYDHKKMAITARGAWECVKRHFREIGVDIQSQDFTVTGVGDMAGDVFGNGMLQSRHIRLVAAFNHQHIFIDPQPDAARSFAERQRMFKLPRSSWDDYSRAAISKGGGVYSRSAKTLNLSREAQTLLEVPAQVTPNEAIKAILKAHVDLLWNGGIGTYIKASRESHSDVGDRSNDAVRIDARELNCKVIGEGGNLGVSQLGRIEFARRGGRLNTDFIDNSAGVNTSDVEVNLKILLNGAVRAGEITLAARDRLLSQMTDDVAALVLRNNYLQSQAISTGEFQSKELLGEGAYVIRALERSGDLNRSLEFLPTEEDIAERRQAGEGLTRPELAITLSYCKIWLYRALIHSNVPEDPYLSAELRRYFPVPVQKRFAARLKRHRLRREIIATAITNSMINRVGPVFPVRAQDDTGADPAAIARAYSIAREVFALRYIWSQIEALDNKTPAAVQYQAMFQTTRLLRHMSYWLLENRRHDLDINRAVSRYANKVTELFYELAGVLGVNAHARFSALRSQLVAQHVPDELAVRIASLEELHCALDLVEVTLVARVRIVYAAKAYFDLGERIGLTWIKEQIESLAAEGHWQAVARGTLRDNLYALQARITLAVLKFKGRDPAARVSQWLARHSAAVDSLKRVVVDLRTGSAPDFATLSVALQAVRRLARV
ncbi:MAG TPA: NAD-glutamate dehydrogenase [Steroidobacteraceae bacterium]|jgi:glutamate dehydrogenase|nr:NAD-glutamate dehydrogenase [Steroidobacteraceae bacterium]